MKTLDRSKPFGEVCGSGFRHRYEQDGHLFDGTGREVTETASGPVSAPATDDLKAIAAATLDQSAAKVEAELAGASDAMLAALKEGENAGKTRKGLMAAIDAEIARRGTADPTEQVNAQLEG